MKNGNEKYGNEKYEYVKLSREEYEEFWRGSEQRFFANRWEVLELSGKVIYRGVKKNGKLVIAGGFREQKRYFGLKEYVSYKGPMGDFGDKEAVKKLLMGMKRELKAVKISMQPNVREFKRDENGEIILTEKRNEVVSETLRAAGMIEKKYIEGESDILWQYVLDMQGKSYDELLGKMRKETKRLLVQSENSGCEVSKMEKDEMGVFYEVMRETGESKGFTARGKDYYEKMWDVPSVEFVKVEMNPVERLKTLGEIIEKNKGVNGKHARDAVESAEGKVRKIKEIFGEKPEDKKVVLSVGMFAWTDKEVVFVFSGNVRKYMKFEGQYAMHDKMIKKALASGVERYNFYGIPVGVKKGCKGYNVFDFKRGFSGQVEEMAGRYDLPTSPMYYVLEVMAKIRRMI